MSRLIWSPPAFDDMEPEFRDWLIEFGDGGYIARYHYDGGDIVVLATCHTKEAGF